MNRLASVFIVAFLACVFPGRGAQVQTDVCVYGATSGGVVAAVQAARMGKSVVLLSTNTHVGGMTSGGLSWTDGGVNASIGGIAIEFYKGVGARYNSSNPVFAFEPHVAEQEFNALLTGAGVTVRTNQLLASVNMSGQRIAQITMVDGTVYQAAMFIDTSYEGDLMAMAGVTWTLGRESSATYGENLNGVTAGVQGDTNATNLDPYLVPGNPASGLLPLLQSGNGGTVGAADSLIQAYNYRLCLTTNAANQNPIPAPPGYNESTYELVGRVIDARVAAGKTPQLTDFLAFFSLPGSKFDINNNSNFSTDYVGDSAGYPTAPYAQRNQTASDHLAYLQGFLYYLGHSTRVPSAVRTQMLGYGLCLDEFTDNGGWPNQLYVREARRMVSDYVMLQQDCLVTRMANDSIGLAAYSIDSHNTQRFAKSGAVWSEGGVNRSVYEAYRVSYRSIVPRVGECQNLLVPWALSASHIAFSSIRTEPVFMILSQSAATAAAFAIDDNVPVQQVNYAKLALQLRADKQLLTRGSTDSLGIVMDNTDATGVTLTGAWSASTTAQGYVGTNYVHDGNTGKGTKSVRFTPTIPTTGSYDVFLRFTSDTNRATNVPVDVVTAAGTTTYTVNQQANGGTWVQLNTGGPVTLTAGTACSVLVRTDATNGYVIADAVRFTPSTPTDTTVQVVASGSIARETSPLQAARFTVVRSSSQTANAWTIPYTVSGTAVPGTDYVALSGSVTIPAGQTSASIPITPISANLIDGNSSVTVALNPGTGFTVGTLNSATVQIVNPPTVQIAATNAIASEANPTVPATLTVSRDASQTLSDWTVSYTIGGSAASSRYVPLPGSITIPAGQTSATIQVVAIADNIAEGNQTVILTLLAGSSFTVGSNSSATAQILDKPIDAWRFANFTAAQLADPTISGDNADPDGDGITNLAEYAFGLNPLIHNSPPTTSSQDATGHLALSYSSNRAATDVTIIAEGSTDLNSWSSGPDMVQEIARVQQGAVDLVTVRLVPSNPVGGYLRVRVTRP